jgi:transposase
MRKQANQRSRQAIKGLAERVDCGVDVSAGELVVAAFNGQGVLERRTFENRAAGHRMLIRWLLSLGARARVAMEATGVYSLDLALALDAAEGVEVTLLNPKAVHDFARSRTRTKTDKADAEVLAEHCRRMEFEPWARPSIKSLQLRWVTRHLAALMEDRTRELNRLHAAQQTIAAPACVIADLKHALKRLDKRVLGLRAQARALIAEDAGLERKFILLVAMPGIGEISALSLLAELSLLAPGLSARQWVASSGLDPMHQTSGSSVQKRPRISYKGSRHLRRALYMPALVAARSEPHMAAFYQKLLGRHKAKMQALIAVARKMLHAIHGIFKHGTPYNGAILFPQQQLHPIQF